MAARSVVSLVSVCALCSLAAVVGAQEQETDRSVVTIDQGTVRGQLSGTGYHFYGIPYATAPTGRDKFKAPLPPPTWTDEFVATGNAVICPQGHNMHTREDCLVVNVHVPTAPALEVLPVIVYIHGGAFVFGSGAAIFPEFLLQHNVIVVTANYRLGATGFLCLMTEEIPGNAGYKDQVEALRWVQRNIASFGGNPDDVTIAGFSAGSTSVEYLMLSPMADGLFNKVISESGSVLTAMAEARDPIAFAKRFVSDTAGRVVEDLTEVQDYLLSATSDQLITDRYISYQLQPGFDAGFTLCVEREIDGVENFLTEPPLDILKHGRYSKRPYLTGMTSKDGSLFLEFFDEWKIQMNDNLAEFLPGGLNFGSIDEKNAVANRVKQFYFNDEPVSDETISGFMDFTTDISFGYSLLRSARLHVQNSVPVYLYLYKYIVSEYPSHPHDDKIRGAVHCAQSFSVNRIRAMYDPLNESEDDIVMRDRLALMWSNFAKYGDPVPATSDLVPVNWEPMQYDRMNYLSMDRELEAQELLLGDRFTLWDEIYETYYGSTDETGQSRVVDIEQGPVRGYKSPLGDYHVFYGIRYATAPTGRDKFKAPLPPPTWTEIFEATENLTMCPQPFLTTASEDCLVVNVYVPKDVQGPLPVMVYIHGGGFIDGLGTMISPEFLLQHNVVTVTLNYRLGATGFLCLQTEEIPGNAGYKDQVAALGWVKRNIASFGGNPNEVTIAGFSAGSTSVEYMMLSPMAEGLFHKVISESGSVLTPMAEGRDPIGFAKRFVSDIAGRDIEDLAEIENYLLTATSEHLFAESYDSSLYRTDFGAGFTLCVEREIDGAESFLTESPLRILRSGNYYKVPYLTGMASEEGALRLFNFDEWKERMEHNFADFLPVGLNFASEHERNAVANRIKTFYFNYEPVSEANIRGYVDYITDVTFGSSLLRSARLHVENSVPVYLYLYSYVVSEYPSHPHDDKIRGAIHCAQSFCVNRIRVLHNPVNENEDDILMRDRLSLMWSNFAKYGVPVPATSDLVPVSWEPMEYDKMNYLSMDVELEARDLLLGDRFTLWNDIYETYYGSTDETGQSIVVDIEQGPVRGYKSHLGEFYVFYGIPYATAPTGRDKFKASLPPPSWTDVFEATNSNIMCHQTIFTQVGLTRDDCLVVNIHTPINRQGTLPVMVYIHGGGFTLGYGAMVSPEDLVAHDLVMVTFNYRLGPTGFLCMRNEDIPGNAGYKDQVAALRWVQSNIARFGGDPNDVTIAGFSAGGISVEFMMLSPIANRLFHKAISETGSALTSFSENRDPITFAKRFASDIAGNEFEDLAEVENYLLDATTEQLFTHISSDTNQYRSSSNAGFSFCVEEEIDGIESFLSEAPLEVLKKGNYNNVTFMTGMASEEGLLFLSLFDDWQPAMEENFHDFLPEGLNFANENEKRAVTNRVKQFYFNNEPVSYDNIRGFVDFATDISSGYALLRSARLHVQNSVPVYLYLYKYVVSEYPSHPHDDKIRGAVHCAQSFCVNRIPWMHNPINESEEDLLMRKRLTKMWSDFAKTGVPVPETSELVPVSWEPMEYDRMNYLSMDVELEARESLLGDRFTLWDEIYEQYYGGGAPVLAASAPILLPVLLIVYLIF